MILRQGSLVNVTRKVSKRGIVKRVTPKKRLRTDFDHVLALIDAARSRAVAAVNTALIDLYWTIGERISVKIAMDRWGKGTVQELAGYIQKRQPNARSFSASNLWR